MWRPETLLFAIAMGFILAMQTSFLKAAEGLNSGAQTGIGACYSARLNGHRVASGARYNPNALTAAHATIPLGAHIRVTNLDNGKTVVLLVNDRLSAHAVGGIIVAADCSPVA